MIADGDGGKEGIKSFNDIADRFFYHTCFAFNGDDPVIPKAVIVILLNNDLIGRSDGDDTADLLIDIDGANDIAEFTITDGLISAARDGDLRDTRSECTRKRAVFVSGVIDIPVETIALN